MSEALKVVGDECGTRQFVLLLGQNSLPLLFSHLFQQSLDALGTVLILEAIDDAASSVVEESFGEHAQVFIRMSSSIQCLDVFCVHGNGRTGVLHHFIPLAEGIVARGSVGIVDRIRFAEDSFAIEVNRLVVVFRSVGFVASSFQLACICCPVLLIVSAAISSTQIH